MVSIVYKHRHFINLGVGLTWDTETPYWVKAAPTFCGPHDHYSRKKARELGIKRLLKYGCYIVPTKSLHALEMLDRVTPRDHKSHKWIKSFVMALLGGEEIGLVPVQQKQEKPSVARLIVTMVENLTDMSGAAPLNMLIAEKTIDEVENERWEDKNRKLPF